MKHCNKTNFIFSKFQARDSSESATESHGTSDRSEGQSRDRTSSGGTQDSSNKEHRYRKAFKKIEVYLLFPFCLIRCYGRFLALNLLVFWVLGWIDFGFY